MDWGAAILALMIIAGVMEASTPGGLDDESPTIVLVGLLMLAAGLLDLIAMGLGIAGLFQAERRKVFAVLGTAFSTLTVLGMVALVVVGVKVQ
ncbi:MAG: hypothetical protein CMJ83_16040 [Planctomycetes bacterium]|nr:hypothetical protein [Planctomycetota bacterium]